MEKVIREAIWNQFGAAIDMLINAISTCPDAYFADRKRFYYIAYHSAIFLDYYLSVPPAGFSPLLPFTQKEASQPVEAVGDLIPDRHYTKDELIAYVARSREKCKETIESLSGEKFHDRFTEGDDPGDMDYPILEILLYNLRHTQHHTAQLHLLLRQDLDLHAEWSFRAGDIA
ncbi:DinB family protein [Flavobacterium magnum]|uniref:DinB family protein n=1 Tax=Flavobacterium magnum TaxID=2162713 RepID=A0A2S0RJW5_9FLAO|nr:DinB family protein [Flavobacterium magnum]AWA31441.1 DinB family protein [Flavobacterium magnum]